MDALNSSSLIRLPVLNWEIHGEVFFSAGVGRLGNARFGEGRNFNGGDFNGEGPGGWQLYPIHSSIFSGILKIEFLRRHCIFYCTHRSLSSY